MTIATTMRLHAFIAPDPQLHITYQGEARFSAYGGARAARKEPDGSFTPREPSLRDLVTVRATERVQRKSRTGDSMVASGSVDECQVARDGKAVRAEDYVACCISRDAVRLQYCVERRQPDPPERTAATLGAHSQPAVGR